MYLHLELHIFLLGRRERAHPGPRLQRRATSRGRNTSRASCCKARHGHVRIHLHQLGHALGTDHRNDTGAKRGTLEE